MKFNYFTPSTYPAFIKTCRRLLDSGEPGVFIGFPYNGTERRVEQLIQDHANKFPYPLTHIHLSPKYEDIEDILSKIKNKKSNKKNSGLALLITNVDYCVKTGNAHLIDKLSKLHEKNPKFRLIFFFESDITSPQMAKRFNQTHIFSNIHYLPFYSEKDATAFLNYLANKWKIKITQTKSKQIVKQCGGHLWLLKQALRLLRDNPNFNPQNLIREPSIRFRLKSIYESYNASEKKNLLNSPLPLLREYARRQKSYPKLKLKDNKIYMDKANITTLFSKQEQAILRLFLSSQNKTTTRDEIANAIWKNNEDEKYSIWAIEQLISRLRNKAAKLGLPKKIIKTIRNKGYILAQYPPDKYDRL